MHAAFIDTEMAALASGPKISPESVAQQTFDAVEAGRIEVLADERTRYVKASLAVITSCRPAHRGVRTRR